MSISHLSPSLPREPDMKQIDHNGSIRSTYLSIEDIKAMGDAVARNGVDQLPAFAPFDFFARHKENEKEILRVYRTTATDVEAGETITPAAEWLLDNHYIVEEAIQEVRRDFPGASIANCRPWSSAASRYRAPSCLPGSMSPIPTARSRRKV